MSNSIVVPICTKETSTATATAPWFVQKTEYFPTAATYQPLINGEVAFRAVHLAIQGAKKSVDIICWGFQPSMYFIRDGQHPCIGELLEQKAKEGVRVRVLGWQMGGNVNAVGASGEANLPGHGLIKYKDRAMQNSDDKQYQFDCSWFARHALAVKSAILPNMNPVFVGRGFDLLDRAEIAYRAKFDSVDKSLNATTAGVLAAAVTHHQKMVLVDYELPESATGFVMGHNMLDEYWDTNQHSARIRTPHPAPNKGPRGHLPRQDISSRVTGPILEHLHHNFATAWKRETGEDLLKIRNAKAVGTKLQPRQGADATGSNTLMIAQILRTQAQEGKRDIEQLYLKAVNNATSLVYIENQYFRWPPLAEKIKAAAKLQTGAGRDPCKHGSLHLFVVTNAGDDGIGPGIVNTQRMLENLGRADVMPEVTKLERIDRAKAASAAQNATITDKAESSVLSALTGLSDLMSGNNAQSNAKEAQKQREKAEKQREQALKRETEKIQDEKVLPEDIPGLKVHVCTLVAPDSPAGKPWMPVYVHSKLMIVNDVFTTHGSANINTRSMEVDSELNIAHEWMSVTQKMRRELWALHTSGRGAQDKPAEAYKAWSDIIGENKKRLGLRQTPYASLIEFYRDDPKRSNMD